MPRLPKSLVLCLVACLLPLLSIRAQQPPPLNPQDPPTAKDVAKSVEKGEADKTPTDPIERIKEEGLKRSQVMATLGYLTDVIGPRLTGSPNLKRSNEWTRDKLASWGLANAHLEPWGEFGRGWSLRRFSAQVVAPQCIPLIAYPNAWSPGTSGPLVAEVVHFDVKDEAGFAKYKGKLKGAIVLGGQPRALAARFEPLATRLNDHDLLVLADAPLPKGARAARKRSDFASKKIRFLVEEGASLLVDPSTQGDGGTLFVSSALLPATSTVPSPTPASAPAAKRASVWDKDAPGTIPQIVVASEHFNRMVRMMEQGEVLKMEVDLAVEYHDDDLQAYNTVAEIPGTDLKDEVVMLGGHMDSWHSGTGATDNASGVSVAMEAVRILKTLDLKPRRTIRIALWTGEEQGLFGSRGYVAKHFGQGNAPSPPSDAPRTDSGSGLGSGSGSGSGPSTAEDSTTKVASTDSATKSEFEKFSAYYNLDNGTGKIRGVYLQGNEAVRPIFRNWIQPFRSLDAATLTIANTGGTDHQSFDRIGLPGFQFIQDAIEYSSRTHHSNQDVFDRIQGDDLKQAAVILAAFVYNTAMLDERLPRKPASR